MEKDSKPSVGGHDPWRDNELARRLRLREHAKRPLGVNLAEGIALSEFALRFLGAARRR